MGVVVLTPNLTGRDGVSHLSRLIVRAYPQVSVVALHEPPALQTFEHAPVAAAGSRAPHFAALALHEAMRCGGETTVIVVHLHLAPASFAFAARGAPVATVLCGIEAWTPLTWSQRTLLLRSERVLAISEHTAARFRAANERLAGIGIAVCHPGITWQASAPAAAPDSTPRALIVGRMAADERYKGHDALLDVWRDVRAVVPDAILEIAGGGDDRSRLEAKAVALGLGDAVRFLGIIGDQQLQQAYDRCTAVVMPSANEGFGLVFLEAMRAGRPCIAARGAASEIVDDGRTGILVPAGGTSALTAAIVRLLADPASACAMGAAGRRRFQQQFTERQFHMRLTKIVPERAIAGVTH